MRRVVLFSLLLCFLIPLNIEAKKKPFGNGFYAEITEDGVLISSGTGKMPEERPYPWYKEKEKGRIRKIIIEEGITSIASSAFWNIVDFEGKTTKRNSAIKEVILPNSLEIIESEAFKGNLGLTKIKLGENVRKIGYSAFSNCGLYDIIIPNSVTEIEKWAFESCRNLTKVVLSKSITEIKDHTFIWCYRLTNVNIPNNVTNIGESAFEFCEDLQEIIIPEGVKTIGKDAFLRYNNPINKLSIPLSVKSIGHKSFALENRVGGASIPYKCNILSLPNYIDLNNCMKIGLSEESVSEYKINNTPEKVIKRKGAYTSVVEIKNGNKVYYKVSKGGFYGLTDSKGTEIIQPKMDALEPAGDRYLRIKNGGYYGIMNYQGKTIIPINNHYTSIGDFNTNKGTFAFTKKGFSGVCDAQGREISTTRLAPTADDIKTNSGYASAVEMKNGSTKYYKVSKGGRYGLTDSEDREIVPCEMEALESAGTGYLKYKINGFWGLMNYTGKILIGTDRGYTSIGNFVTFTKRFPYTMTGYKGECDINGRQISKIKVETPKQAAISSSSSSNSSSSNNSGNGTTQTVVVEHHRDPVPVQEWQACFGCGGMGTMGWDHCGGSGTKYIGDRLHICSRCNGRGIIPCNICYGNKGQYITVYR